MCVYSGKKRREEATAPDYQAAGWVMQRLCTEQLARRGSTKLRGVVDPVGCPLRQTGSFLGSQSQSGPSLS